VTNSPTLPEFTTAVREAFGYLGAEFGFQEKEPPRDRLDVNPFMVWFASPTTLVQVEGINWGFAAQVLLGPANRDKRSDGVPLWVIMQLRRPGFSREPRGQLGDVRTYAQALREVAGDVLRGDFAIFPSARSVLAAERARHHDELHKLDRNASAAAAVDAFRAGNFKLVVELLEPNAELLSPAERARLEYARAHEPARRATMLIEYASGEPVRVGDQVRIKRRFRRALTGVVVHVYDPTQPSPPKGNNELGFHVETEDGRGYWFPASRDARVELVRRRAD
jgi:hypothetical protein